MDLTIIRELRELALIVASQGLAMLSPVFDVSC
jgi:hypothetical protein